MPSTKRLIWMAFAAGVGIVAGRRSQRALGAGWSLIEHQAPPQSPSAAQVGKPAVWTALLGAEASLTNLFVLRGTAAVRQQATGHEPPD